MCVCWPGGSHPTDRGPQTTKCCWSHGKSLLSYQWWSRGEGASPRVIREDGPPLAAAVRDRLPAPPSEELSHLARSFPRQLFQGGSDAPLVVQAAVQKRGENQNMSPCFSSFFTKPQFFFFFLNFGISSRFWAKIQVIFVLPETWLPVPWSNSSLLAPAAIWHSQRME